MVLLKKFELLKKVLLFLKQNLYVHIDQHQTWVAFLLHEGVQHIEDVNIAIYSYTFPVYLAPSITAY